MVELESKRDIGKKYEELACAYLAERGYEILERNYRARPGEVDIIARDEGYIVFAEVKYRKTGAYGSPLDAVGVAKQQKIRLVALYYLSKEGYPEDTPARFDVVGITDSETVLIKNAF